MMSADCVFCQIVRGALPATVLARWRDVVAIKPLNPVTGGHALVIPVAHVRDAVEDPNVTALTMRAAAVLSANLMPESFNIITSVGAAATQTVFHFHVHLVPRMDGDGLALPWTAR